MSPDDTCGTRSIILPARCVLIYGVTFDNDTAAAAADAATAAGTAAAGYGGGTSSSTTSANPVGPCDRRSAAVCPPHIIVQELRLLNYTSRFSNTSARARGGGGEREGRAGRGG